MKDNFADAFGLPRSKKENHTNHNNNGNTKSFKETLAYQGLQKLYKVITKNSIPSDPQKVLEMEKRLSQEDNLKQDVDKAKLHIKEMLKQRKEANKAIKRENRRKVKAFIMKLFRK